MCWKQLFTNANCVILDVWIVSIGNNVMLGPGAMILPVNHPENVSLRNRGYGLGLPITIEYGVWGGAHATINPGIHIGCNRIIGAGSVVANSIPANAIPTGNPCKIIRAISRNIAYFRGGTLDGYTPKTKCCYSCL